MFKLLFRIVFLGIALLIAFVALSFWSGGEKIRWFGKKVEQGSEKAAETADRLKKTEAEDRGPPAGEVQDGRGG